MTLIWTNIGMEEELQDWLDTKYRAWTIAKQHRRVMETEEPLVWWHAQSERTAGEVEYDSLDLGDLWRPNTVCISEKTILEFVNRVHPTLFISQTINPPKLLTRPDWHGYTASHHGAISHSPFGCTISSSSRMWQTSGVWSTHAWFKMLTRSSGCQQFCCTPSSMRHLLWFVNGLKAW